MLEKALSREEQRFAAEHHQLIYAFLNQSGLFHDDFYSVAVAGYLNAVHRYLAQPALRRFSFSTIAFRAMKRSIYQDQRSRDSQKRRAGLISLDTGAPDGGPLPLSVPSAEQMLLEELEERLLLHSLAQKLPPDQFDLVRLRLWGFGVHEIAVRKGISDKKVRRLLRRMRETFWEVCRQA